MRYGIFSDVHSNLEALEAAIEAYKSEAIDKYICTGDIVGYAADPNACADKVRALCKITIAGNHDRGCTGQHPLSNFNPFAAEAILWTKNELDKENFEFLRSLVPVFRCSDFCLVHGSLNEPDKFNYILDNNDASLTFQLLDKTGLCFVGHTHIAGVFIKDRNNTISYSNGPVTLIKEGNSYIINAGSVGQPRDGNALAAYCIYDTESQSVEIKRVAYDIKTARQKIIDAGLPQFLAERLIDGR